MSRSSKSSKKISRVFRVKFSLKPGKRSRIKTDAGEMAFEWFVKHFGQIEVAPRYKVTVEVV